MKVFRSTIGMALILGLAFGCGTTTKVTKPGPGHSGNGKVVGPKPNPKPKPDPTPRPRPRPNLDPAPERVKHSRPEWTDQTTYAEDERFVGVGIGQNPDQTKARESAIQKAMTELAKLKEVKIQSIAQVHSVTLTSEETQELLEQSRDIINAETNTRLRFTEVIGQPYVEKDKGLFIYYARVAIPRDKLFPEKRIEAIFTTKPGSHERVKALLELAHQYESEGFLVNAEAAYKKVVSQRGATAEDILESGWFLYNKAKDFAESSRLVDYLAEKMTSLAKGNTTRESWARLKSLLDTRIPTVNESIVDLKRLAEAHIDPRQLQSELSDSRRDPTGGTIFPLVLTVRDNPRKILTLWIDHEDFAVHQVIGGSKPFTGVKVIDLMLPKGSKGGEILVWALPGDSPVWPLVQTIQGKTSISRDKSASKADKVLLWSLSSRLRQALDARASTPGASGKVILRP